MPGVSKPSIAVELFVRAKGLEPPRQKTLDPKSSASTNSATPANRGANINEFFLIHQRPDKTFLKNVVMIISKRNSVQDIHGAHPRH